MKQLPKKIEKIIGRWKLTDWKNQYISHHPDEDTFENIGKWEDFNIDNSNNLSNFLELIDEKENLRDNNFHNIEIEFTNKNIYEDDEDDLEFFNFNIYFEKKKQDDIVWEVYDNPEYCDLSVGSGEVYQFAMLKIDKVNTDELILIEILENSESDAYLQKLSFKKNQ